MDLRVLEGQTSRGLFSNSIFDPSVIGATVECRAGGGVSVDRADEARYLGGGPVTLVTQVTMPGSDYTG